MTSLGQRGLRGQLGWRPAEDRRLLTEFEQRMDNLARVVENLSLDSLRDLYKNLLFDELRTADHKTIHLHRVLGAHCGVASASQPNSFAARTHFLLFLHYLKEIKEVDPKEYDDVLQRLPPFPERERERVPERIPEPEAETIPDTE